MSFTTSGATLRNLQPRLRGNGRPHAIMRPPRHCSDRRLCVPLVTHLRGPLVLASFLLVTILAPLAQAQPAPVDEGSEPRREPAWTLASGKTVKLFPSGDLFPIYVADPHRPTNAVLVNFNTRVGIEETSSPRIGLSGGGRFGLLKIAAPTPTGRSWQISLDAGLDALFDSQNKQDAIGWDGNYGLTVTTASGPLAFKFAILHVSAHLGDEYAERTGQQRRNYTREELAAGFSRRLGRRWRTYAETGVAYVERDEEQEPLRFQGGIEYESPRKLWGNRFSWYWASDLSSMQERGWRLDTTMQGGVTTSSEGRTFRVGLQVHDGRPTINEFFQSSETCITLGFWLDF